MHPNAFRRAGLVPPAQLRGLGQLPSPADVQSIGPSCGSGPALAYNQPGQQTSLGWCEAQRVLLAGGAMNQIMLDPSFTPFEQLYRSLPEQGMFSPGVGPARPFRWTLGAFRPEQGMCVALFDLRPDIYRFSGVDAGDVVPVEARRFSSAVGFDVTVDSRRGYARMEYQLDPVAISHTGAGAFRPSDGSTDLFSDVNINAAISAAPAGVGAALQPQRPQRPGSPGVPFMLLARSAQTVRVDCVVFHPIPSPIAFIEYAITGIFFPEKVLDAYLRCMSPKADIPR